MTGLRTGVEGRDLSIGPALRYNITPSGCITFKYQPDIWAQNRPYGSKLWIRFAWAW
jgi:hypothetical protein